MHLRKHTHTGTEAAAAALFALTGLSARLQESGMRRRPRNIDLNIWGELLRTSGAQDTFSTVDKPADAGCCECDACFCAPRRFQTEMVTGSSQNAQDREQPKRLRGSIWRSS